MIIRYIIHSYKVTKISTLITATEKKIKRQENIPNNFFSKPFYNIYAYLHKIKKTGLFPVFFRLNTEE